MLENNILVSVCVKVYNHEKYISKALDSILKQKVSFKYEIIIGDDCSTDNSAHIIKDYAENHENIRPILRDKNIGGTHNGIDITFRATGKYICIIDGDDFFLDPEKLEKQVRFLEEHMDFFAVASRNKVVDENNAILPYKHYEKPITITADNLGKVGVMPLVGSFMFRNVFLNNSKEQNRFETMCYHHSIIDDWTWFLYFLDKSDIYVMPEYMVCYRKVVSSNATNFNSLYRLKKNRYDVIVERMQYEQALNRENFKRLNLNYRMVNKASEVWFAILIDKNKQSREYGKQVYITQFKDSLTCSERISIPYRVFKKVVYHIKLKFKQLYYKRQTRKELGQIV